MKLYERGMDFVYSDGGRSKYFGAKNVGDCVTRAICNATGRDYKEVYDTLGALAKGERGTRTRGGHRSKSSARNGVFKGTIDRYLTSIGWVKHPTCAIGSSARVHLTEGECPKGNCIVQVSKHLTNTKDGVIYDTFDCSEPGRLDEFGRPAPRMIYAYWTDGKGGNGK